MEVQQYLNLTVSLTLSKKSKKRRFQYRTVLVLVLRWNSPLGHLYPMGRDPRDTSILGTQNLVREKCSRNGCLPVFKRFRKFWLDFRSVSTVRVVYHLPKISGLSSRARLDSSYNMKLVRNSRNL